MVHARKALRTQNAVRATKAFHGRIGATVRPLVQVYDETLAGRAPGQSRWSALDQLDPGAVGVGHEGYAGAPALESGRRAADLGAAPAATSRA